MKQLNVLIVGCDKGSWQMRGHQLGKAIGAKVTAKPQGDDWRWADVVILIKRAAETWYREAKASQSLLLWDVLDVWRQPSANQRPEADLVRDILGMRNGLKIARLIGATKAMAEAIGGVYVPHHSRLGLAPTPIRPERRVVAYEGSERYLGSWRAALERECARLDLTFVVNPPDLSQVDLLVAFRGEQWDGALCRRWKSGVKYVNAIAAGRPILTQSCAAYAEIQPTGMVVEHPSELARAIEVAADITFRQTAYEQGCQRAAEFSLDTIAKRYQAIVHQTVRKAAA